MESKEVHASNEVHGSDEGIVKEGYKETMKEAFHRWLGLFLVLVAVIIVYLLINNIQGLVEGFLSLFSLIQPVIYGCVIAYILNPLANWIQNTIIRIMESGGKPASDKKKGVVTGISIVLALVFMILIVVILCWMIIPQVVETISQLIKILPGKVKTYYYDIEDNIRNNEFLSENLQDGMLKLTDSLESAIMEKLVPWMQSDFLPGMSTIAVGFVNGISSFVNVLYNLFIGIIVAIYLLLGKKTFSAQAKKIVYCVFNKKHADVLIHYVNLTNTTFSGFIFGKILDSAIVGGICFVLMSVMGLPYTTLISVIIGVTNIIPFFGPYIGLIPSALLIVLVNPMQAVYFTIMIIILMQVDGNIISPAILGESTGLSAFWVLFSILFFGGLWGLPGMIVGVPLFGVIYRIVADIVNLRLKGKALSSATDSYKNLKEIRYNEDNEPEYIEYSKADFVKKKKGMFDSIIEGAGKMLKKIKKNNDKGKKDDPYL